MVVFIRPEAEDCSALLDLLELFGNASGLRTNILKSLANPIHCSSEDCQVVLHYLACRVQEFPILYLGAPLSISKLRRQDLQPILDKMDRKLAGWRA